MYISITSIISVIACMRYEYSIMLPESDEDAVNLLGLSLLAVIFVSCLTLLIVWYFKEPIVNILNSQQIGNYLWLVPPFIFVNGLFLALNNWNSRTKLFKRLSLSRIFSSVSSTATQIGFRACRKSRWRRISSWKSYRTVYCNICAWRTNLER